MLMSLLQIQNDLQYIKDDVNAVERHRIELHRARERCLVKPRMISDDSTVKTTSWPSLMDKRNSSMGAGSQQSKLHDKRKDACSGSDSQNTQAGVSVARKRRVHAQVTSLFFYKLGIFDYRCPYMFCVNKV